MTSFRLSSGGLVDRGAEVSFTFDGRTMRGFEGDTLAAALLANDHMLVGRSFKYHRPRGIVTAGPSEPNALVTIGTGGRTEPNTRATVAEIYQGMEISSQNRWPSLKFDLGALNGLLSPFLGAGFYYKTFMWPSAFWEKVYEPLIRRAAGLGRAAMEVDPDRYEKAWAHCDLLVIGSGPAGLMAARTAARAGLRVILAEQDFRMGGSLLSERLTLDGMTAHQFVDAVLEELASYENVTLMPRTTVFGYYNHGFLGLAERVSDHLDRPGRDLPRERLWQVRATRVILATGAIERHMVFANNDRPGIMLASAARTFLNHHGVAVGRNVGVYTAHDAAYEAAFDLKRAGVRIAAAAPATSRMKRARSA